MLNVKEIRVLLNLDRLFDLDNSLLSKSKKDSSHTLGAF